MTYDVGDAATLTTRVYDTSGALVDATVALTVTAPDATTSTPGVTHLSTGVYSAVVSVGQAGIWFYTWTVSGTVTAVDSGQFDAADPAPPVYATLTELKARIDRTDTVRDDQLADALEAASRQVDQDTGRRFWLDRTATARVFNPQYRIVPTWDGEKLLIDDIGDATGLVAEIGSGSNWVQVADFDTGPDNALTNREAITWLLRPYLPWITWPRQRIRVTARWGWPAVPAQIKQATLLRAHRLYSRRGSPEGVAGFSDLGVVRVGRFDPDYDALISNYVKDGFG